MGLWDEVERNFETQIEEVNKYLENPNEGIKLIAKLLSYDKKYNIKRKVIKKLDYLLDQKLLETSGKVNIANELELYEKLVNLSDKLYEQNKMQLLRDKSVIGIGGKFSAGKSKFINALLNIDILPEDQTPTTSIATYIVRESSEDVRAYTYNDQDIALDMQAAQALTHVFYKRYGIGFSRFINNLVINVPVFPYENVALLDTPGYSKSDSGMKRSVSDAEKAYTQLKTVDFLIWLIDIENGVIQQLDIDFIRALKVKNPILIVFNKADKKTDSAISNILQSSMEILKNTGIDIYDVIAYSALERREYFGTNKLASFMVDADKATNRNADIEKQIKDIISTISKELDSEKKKMIERRNEIGNIIFRSEDVMEIQTLVNLYSEAISSIEEIENCTIAFETTKKGISNLLASIREI
jgi:small GTP-binding protein